MFYYLTTGIMLSHSFLYEYFKPIAFYYRTACPSPTLLYYTNQLTNLALNEQGI